MLAVIFAIYFISSVVTYGGSVAATHMASITEMPRTWFGAAFTIGFIAAGFGGTVAAIAARFIGERYVVVSGMTVTAIGCLIMQFAGEYRVVFIVAFGVIVGGGATFATVVPMQTMIARWFVKRRALANGIALSSGGLGGATGSLFANEIIESTGGEWRLVWMLWAIISVVAASIGWRWIKNKPEEVGQLPDGVTASDDAEATSGKNSLIRNVNVYQTRYDWPLMEVIRHRVLWHIIFIAILTSAATYMVLTHGIIHLMDRGIDSTTASISLGIITFASIGGRLISGLIGDRFEPRYLLAIAAGTKTVGILMILQADSTIGVYIYGLLTGLGLGMSLVALYTMMGNYFGPTHYRNILGFIMPIITIGGAMSPVLGGIVYDTTGNYSIAFYAAAACAALAAIGTMLLKPLEKG
ncbi:MAG: MFS transporter [Gammaproteobacteria bacterium]